MKKQIYITLKDHKNIGFIKGTLYEANKVVAICQTGNAESLYFPALIKGKKIKIIIEYL